MMEKPFTTEAQPIRGIGQIQPVLYGAGGYNLEFERDIREIQKAVAKATALEEAKNYGQIRRQKMREAEAERKRAIYEEVELTDFGEIRLVTRNLSVEARPREISNARIRSFMIFQRQKNPVEQICALSVIVGNEQKTVFLSAERAGKEAYLLQRLRSVGIFFKTQKAKQGEIAVQLWGRLLEQADKPVVLPDEAGWSKASDGEWHFVEKEELTWTKITALCK